MDPDFLSFLLPRHQIHVYFSLYIDPSVTAAVRSRVTVYSRDLWYCYNQCLEDTVTTDIPASLPLPMTPLHCYYQCLQLQPVALLHCYCQCLHFTAATTVSTSLLLLAPRLLLKVSTLPLLDPSLYYYYYYYHTTPLLLSVPPIHCYSEYLHFSASSPAETVNQQ